MTTLRNDVRPCLSDEEIDRFHAFELDDAQRAAIRAHVERCSACAERCDRLRRAHDTWIGRMRSAGPPPADRIGAAGGASPLRPESVPGYEIHEELARGGQGVVYRATQTSTRRQVALKVLRDGAIASDDTRRRFQREIELVAGLRHPSIVSVYDSGVTAEGRRYCAMELLRGTPLRREDGLASGASVRATVERFAAVCEAVGHAHQRGVIHRDLKPSNILVDEAGAPHVLDFGLARAISDGRDTRLTQTGQVGGTLPYMSPEQVRGLGDAADTRTDVYALGVILYELLSGHFPYGVDGDTVTVMRAIAETAPIRLSRNTVAGAAQVDDELETIVLKALEKDPERRYQTAGELARDLRRYLAGEPIDAKRDSGWYVLRKALARYRLRVAAAGLVVLLIAGAAVWLGVLYAEQSRLRADAERRFDQVRDIAGSFIFQFDPMIRHLPGTAEARRLLVEKGLAYLETLSAEAEGDLNLRYEVAVAYLAIGDVLGDRTTSNLGEYERAAECYRKAEQILASLAEAFDENCDFLRTRVLALLKLADVDGGAPSAAPSPAERAVAVAEARAERCPDDPQNDNLLADALQRLSDQRRVEGDQAGARAVAERLLEYAERHAAARPDDVWAQRDLGVVLTRLAMMHHADGESQKALELYERFIAVAERAIAAAPENLVGYRDAAVGHQWVGIIRLESGAAAEAVAPLEESARIIRDMLRREPQSDEFAGQLVVTLTRLCEALLARGDADGARRVAAECAAAAKLRAERFPDDGKALRALAVAYYKQHEIDAAHPDAAATAEERCAPLRRTLEIFVDMQSRGLLAASDIAVPDMLRTELAACED